MHGADELDNAMGNMTVIPNELLAQSRVDIVGSSWQHVREFGEDLAKPPPANAVFHGCCKHTRRVNPAIVHTAYVIRKEKGPIVGPLHPFETCNEGGGWAA